MEQKPGIGLAEVIFIAAVIAVLFTLAGGLSSRTDTESRRIRCRSNLHQLAKGMATYLNEHGNNTWYPFPIGRGLRPNDFNGAEWLATLYWTGVVPDPGVFLCPTSPDENHNGEDFGADRAIPGKFGPHTVSYAGMHAYSLTDKNGQPILAPVKDDFPPNEPMGCDDTEPPINHGTRRNGGISILFFDSHVELRLTPELDIERAVGQRPGLLWRLRN